jgi:hypothetical protein
MFTELKPHEIMMMITRYFHFKGKLISNVRIMTKKRMYELIEEHNIPIMDLWKEHLLFKEECRNTSSKNNIFKKLI